MFEYMAGPRLRTLAAGKALGAGPRRGEVQAWSGPLLRTCAEGERQHVERGASGVWSSGVWR